MKTIKRLTLLVFCMLLLISVLAGCGGSGYEKKLVGSWYTKGYSDADFTFYSDGTCEVRNEYGTGRWSIMDGNVLKIIDFYGETETADIVSLEDGCLTLNRGQDGQSVFYDAP